MNKKGLRKFLHNFFRFFTIFLVATLLINIIIVAVVKANHNKKSAQESTFMTPPGKLVDVDGHNLHVIEKGEDKDTTIVILHSGKNYDDSIAMQPFFEKLKEDFHIIYIDRNGYGFSENYDTDKDIDTILSDTRKLLANTGAKGPYVVVASGTAGIEAMYWANKYPEEISQIVGIDMNYPEEFADVTTEEYCGFLDYMMVKFCDIGGLRLVSSIKPTDKYNKYNATQMNVRKSLLYQRGYTSMMYAEDHTTVNNAHKVMELGVPNTKMTLIYCNSLMEPYINENESAKKAYEKAMEKDAQNGNSYDYVAEYNQGVRDYFRNYPNVTIEEMAGPVRLYTYDGGKLADIVKSAILSNQ